MELNCPKCGISVPGPPEREWKFHQYRVSRFQCKRGDKFNLYSSSGKTFTIPKPSDSFRVCKGCKTENPAEALFCKSCGNRL